MTVPVFLLIGTNQGDCEHNLNISRQAISRQIGPIITQSSVYQTQAWGNTKQPDFYNQVVKVHSRLTPHAALHAIWTIEQSMGRQQKEKWGPRIIDIDILFWDDQIITTSELTIPHPAIPLRKFTLEPLNEIAGDFIHPLLGKTINVLLEECKDLLSVEKLSK